MLAEAPVIQLSPPYSAVSDLMGFPTSFPFSNDFPISNTGPKSAKNLKVPTSLQVMDKCSGGRDDIWAVTPASFL